MANIRVKNLPAEATPNKNDLVPLDNATTRAATIEAIVNAGRPFASQAEAEAGAATNVAMNPLTTKQALAAQGALIFQPFSPVLSATTASFTTADETKLDGVAAGSTANSADAALLARANHTGTQSADTLTDGVTNAAFLATERTKLAGIEASADVTDAANVAAAGAVMESDTSTTPMGFVIDEDDMSSNTATKVPTQQSVKAYVDANAGAAINGSPIIILATGQSNIELHPALAWTPPSNLYLWNGTGSSLGTAFAAMDATTINSAYSYAAEVAKASPSRRVYLLNIGRSTQPISKWMTGSPTPDLYASCKTNVEAALAAIGQTQITEFYWWQGESDYLASLQSTYIANFETVIARFRAESWFPRTTPITIMAVTEYNSPIWALKDFNHVLRQLCAIEPSLRTYVNTQSLLSLDYWEGPSYIHMTAVGYQLAGKLAYVAVSRGTTQNEVGYWRTVVKGASTARASTAITANDPDLKFPIKLGRGHRAKFRILLSDFSTGGAADFKWDIAAPAHGLLVWNSRYVSQVAPTAPVTDMGVTVPTGKTVLVSGSSYVFLEIDVLLRSPSTDGEVIFKWAQNTSNAGEVSVLAGSYVEYCDTGY